MAAQLQHTTTPAVECAVAPCQYHRAPAWQHLWRNTGVGTPFALPRNQRVALEITLFRPLQTFMLETARYLVSEPQGEQRQSIHNHPYGKQQYHKEIIMYVWLESQQTLFVCSF
jgi:hypothetical protein